MVYLNRIYTRNGDQGETDLADGARVAKTDARIIAHAAVDELNAVVGLCLSADVPEPMPAWLRRVQNDLFDLGADLSLPESATIHKVNDVRISSQMTARLETWIDQSNQTLEPLNSFILPGGSNAAARLHLARTVCRRAEIAVWQLAQQYTINPQIPIYLNRLSDLLFVLARICNSNGRKDVRWEPGRRE